MKILFLADGSSHHTKRWVNYFAQRDHLCYLISLEKGIQINAESYYIRPRIKIRALKYTSSYFKVKKIVDEIEPDLINALFVPNYGFLGALLNFKPFVVSAWGSDILISPRKSFLHKLRTRFILTRADLILSDSDFLTQAIRGLGIKEKRILTFPLGIETERYSQEKKRGGPITVLSTRRFEPIYDVKTFIQAMPLVLARSKSRIRFIVVGTGLQSQELKELVLDLKLQDKLEFKEDLSDEGLIETYRDSDIYVSTSLSDSTSVSLLEAMASGLIPIVTDIPGNREWIKDGQNGFLFSPKDHRDLAQKISLVSDDLGNLQSMSKINLQILKHRADWNENMRMVEENFLRRI